MEEQRKTLVKLPTFLVIGVQKAGTTSIYQYLKQHPQVYMSPVKETNFFGKEGKNITTKAGSNIRNTIDSFEEYCQLFEAATDELALGEVSPNYLFRGDRAIEQIKRQLPDVKLIAILRNPVDRAYSDYLMQLREVTGDIMSLDDQIKYKADTSYTILKGFYCDRLQHFFNEFGSDRLKVYLYEDLCQDPVKMMQNMYRFIGVDPTFCPDVSQKSQIAQIPKNKLFNTILKKDNPLKSFVAKILKIFLPLEIRQKIRSSLIELNSKGKTDELLSPETHQQLLELYREDILKLQNLIQRDLSSWLHDRYRGNS
jgi:Sulfotransferase family